MCIIIAMKTTHTISASVTPRLSDEDIDPIEADDHKNSTDPSIEGWLPWDPEDIEDIRRIIDERMSDKQQFIMEAFLDGLTCGDVNVTEKYWRYHFAKAVEFIKQELKL